MVFVSTDSKRSLLQWQQIPKDQGGLGKVQIPLMSDQSHHMSRDYGVLVEKSGMALRGTYIIDPQGIIQHMTVQNVVVGRSVLEALRLVEAFQVAARKGFPKAPHWKLAALHIPTSSQQNATVTDEQIATGFKEFRIDSPGKDRKLSDNKGPHDPPPNSPLSLDTPDAQTLPKPSFMKGGLSVPEQISYLRKDSVVFNFADPLSTYDRVGTPKPVWAKKNSGSGGSSLLEALKRVSGTFTSSSNNATSESAEKPTTK